MTTTTTPRMPAAVGAMSAQLRRQRTGLRAQILAGGLSPSDLIRARHPLVASMRAFEVIQMERTTHIRTAMTSGQRRRIANCNIAAVDAGVNLFVDVGRMSPRQREWLADWLEQHPYERKRQRPYGLTAAAA